MVEKCCSIGFKNTYIKFEYNRKILQSIQLCKKVRRHNVRTNYIEGNDQVSAMLQEEQYRHIDQYFTHPHIHAEIYAAGS